MSSFVDTIVHKKKKKSIKKSILALMVAFILVITGPLLPLEGPDTPVGPGVSHREEEEPGSGEREGCS